MVPILKVLLTIGAVNAVHVKNSVEAKFNFFQQDHKLIFNDLEYIHSGGFGVVFRVGLLESATTGDKWQSVAVKFSFASSSGQQIDSTQINAIVDNLRADPISKQFFDGDRLVTEYFTAQCRGDCGEQGNLYKVLREKVPTDRTETLENMKGGFSSMQVQKYLVGVSGYVYAKEATPSKTSADVALKGAIRMLQAATILGLNGYLHGDLHADNIMMVLHGASDKLTSKEIADKLTIDNMKVMVIDLDSLSTYDMNQVFCDTDASTNYVTRFIQDYNLAVNLLGSSLKPLFQQEQNDAWNLVKEFVNCAIFRLAKFGGVAHLKTFELNFRNTKSEIAVDEKTSCLEAEDEDGDLAFKAWGEWDKVIAVTDKFGPQFGTVISQKVTEIINNRKCTN